MKAIITGSNGQLGWELQRLCPTGVKVLAVDKESLDITDDDAVLRAFESFAPSIVINAAAYTAVDRAESDSATASAVNAEGAAHLARAAAAVNATFIHVSTDFVFDGRASSPYLPDAECNPLSVYGSTKLQGETLVRSANPDAAIIRTAWVYSAHGHNFVKTMLRLLRERGEVRVVADQVGTPTWANGLALALWLAAERRLSGTHHWTDAGVASWYDFAVAIAEEGAALGMLPGSVRVHPIRTQDYPTPAQRPNYSVLDKTSAWTALGRVSDHWRVSLRKMLSEMREMVDG